MIKQYKRNILILLLCSLMLSHARPIQANNNVFSRICNWAIGGLMVTLVLYHCYQWIKSSSIPCSREKFDKGVLGTFSFGSPSHRNNQDRIHYCINSQGKRKTASVAVFDGHGKEAGHIVASKLADDTTGLCCKIAKKTENISPGQGISKAIKDGYAAMDAALPANIATDSGSTAVTVNIYGDWAYFANVGDSRAILCDASGRVLHYTRDHKPDRADEIKRIKVTGGIVGLPKRNVVTNKTEILDFEQWIKIEENKKPRPCTKDNNYEYGIWRVFDSKRQIGLAVSRSFGDRRLRQSGVICTPEVVKVNLTAINAQFLILASDGVWDKVSNAEAAKKVQQMGDDPRLAARALVMQAKANGSEDDITAVVVDLKALRKQFEKQNKAVQIKVVKK